MSTPHAHKHSEVNAIVPMSGFAARAGAVGDVRARTTMAFHCRQHQHLLGPQVRPGGRVRHCALHLALLMALSLSSSANADDEQTLQTLAKGARVWASAVASIHATFLAKGQYSEWGVRRHRGTLLPAAAQPFVSDRDLQVGEFVMEGPVWMADVVEIKGAGFDPFGVASAMSISAEEAGRMRRTGSVSDGTSTTLINWPKPDVMVRDYSPELSAKGPLYFIKESLMLAMAGRSLEAVLDEDFAQATLAGEETIGGVRCLGLVSRRTDALAETTKTLWVAPSKGFAVAGWQYLIRTTTPRRGWRSTRQVLRFQDAGNGLFVPQEVVVHEYKYEPEEPAPWLLSRLITIADVQVGPEIDWRRLCCRIPVGLRVQSERGSYISGATSTADIPPPDPAYSRRDALEQRESR